MVGASVMTVKPPFTSLTAVCVLGTATVIEHFEQLQKVVVDGHRR